MATPSDSPPRTEAMPGQCSDPTGQNQSGPKANDSSSSNLSENAFAPSNLSLPTSSSINSVPGLSSHQGKFTEQSSDALGNIHGNLIPEAPHIYDSFHDYEDIRDDFNELVLGDFSPYETQQGDGSYSEKLFMTDDEAEDYENHPYTLREGVRDNLGNSASIMPDFIDCDKTGNYDPRYPGDPLTLIDKTPEQRQELIGDVDNRKLRGDETTKKKKKQQKNRKIAKHKSGQRSAISFNNSFKSHGSSHKRIPPEKTSENGNTILKCRGLGGQSGGYRKQDAWPRIPSDSHGRYRRDLSMRSGIFKSRGRTQSIPWLSTSVAESDGAEQPESNIQDRDANVPKLKARRKAFERPAPNRKRGARKINLLSSHGVQHTHPSCISTVVLGGQSSGESESESEEEEENTQCSDISTLEDDSELLMRKETNPESFVCDQVTSRAIQPPIVCERIKIKTRMNHPVQLNLPRSECFWCMMPTFGWFGSRPEATVEIDVLSNGSWQEVEHEGSAPAVPPAICEDCTRVRSGTASCKSHSMQAVPQDRVYSRAELLRLSSNGAKTLPSLCLVCINQATKKCRDPNSCGCLLTLCDECAGQAEFQQGDLEKLIGAKERMETSPLRLRADAFLFRYTRKRQMKETIEDSFLSKEP